MTAAYCPRIKKGRFRSVCYWLAMSLLLLCAGCSDEKASHTVDLTNRVANELLQQNNPNPTLSFGIGSMIMPREGYQYYKRLIQYVGNRMGEKIKIVDRGTYDEINRLLEDQKLDIAFVCGGPYVEGRKQFGLKLLALPEVEQGPIYFSYLIVPADSPARKLEDLRGKVFAFTDPKSNSGMIVPNYWLAQIGETPENFFGKTIFTYAHDASIQAVIEKVVDGAAVDSLIWDYLNSINPEVAVKTRIIKKSRPFGIPPLVVRPDLPESTQSKIREILFNMHKDPEGKEILDKMMINRFVPGEDSDYDSIRAMKAFVEKQ
ncbi:MAG: phosphate/phosphite/phosphonate ABC transporter substrate-binding protein [Desulfuromonas sp.]|nr:MAG: phosphate/phosphite/phosphonate ABC transporter substrate-binding protein [Desulfuromonas sp.]